VRTTVVRLSMIKLCEYLKKNVTKIMYFFIIYRPFSVPMLEAIF